MNATVSPTTAPPNRAIADVIRRFWGFETLRPLQAEAIAAGLEKRDSLVVLPTGGGKSLCYQVPPAAAGRTDIVISPLISLMKDQVDGLRSCGYPAAAIFSGMPSDEVRRVEADARAGKLRLLFVAPERLFTPNMMGILRDIKYIGAIAVDEAHCISHWGHDFRPEYRRLADIKQRIGDVSVHAYTATATERVRADIIAQLDLHEPTVLVGDFDRPNLTYRVVPRHSQAPQILEVLARHRDEAAIVYCITRRETEDVCFALSQAGIRAGFYHAGLSPEKRRETQEAFSEERLDVIVATVAFGMGIDRSDVRCVIHAAMPKSLEHYQQEAGRAGRDGLPAECVLLYSPGDVIRWERIMAPSSPAARPEPQADVGPPLRDNVDTTPASYGEVVGELPEAPPARGAAATPPPANAMSIATELLSHMRRFCGANECRHRSLVEYFGQKVTRADCGACDVCLAENGDFEDATELAQKILSCVARVEGRFGVGHVVSVLLGDVSSAIQTRGHDQLSTYGLLKGHSRKELTQTVYQLLDDGLLERYDPDDFPKIRLNAASWEILRGQKNVRIRAKAIAAPKQARGEVASWEGVDRGLFEELRRLRRDIAEERGVAPFLVFPDNTLRDMARLRPSSPRALLDVHGIGERKMSDLGPRFLQTIRTYCAANGVSLDAKKNTTQSRRVGDAADVAMDVTKPGRKVPVSAMRAFEYFDERLSVEQVAETMGRAKSTTYQYLENYIAERRPQEIDCWVDLPTQERVLTARRALGQGPLKPLFEHLNGEVSYEIIRIVLRHREPV